MLPIGRIRDGGPATASPQGGVVARAATGDPRERLDAGVEVGLDLELHEERAAAVVARECLADLELDDPARALEPGEADRRVDKRARRADHGADRGARGVEVTEVRAVRVEGHVRHDRHRLRRPRGRRRRDGEDGEDSRDQGDRAPGPEMGTLHGWRPRGSRRRAGTIAGPSASLTLHGVGRGQKVPSSADKARRCPSAPGGPTILRWDWRSSSAAWWC